MNGESSIPTTSQSSQFDTNRSFSNNELSIDNLKQELNKDSKQSEDSNLVERDSDQFPLLLDPPLTEEEISADLSSIINEASELDDLDMMIQSAGPFQHPRSVAQNYVGHPNANMYHRQSSYHSHHHQVNTFFFPFSLKNISSKFMLSIQLICIIVVVTQIVMTFSWKNP